ncbi:ABC transporter permease subunit [Paenibacillus thiaminolyticus]|uniref:ABC transporter permease n=1 Tax=Paenibacillus thiaminolyticus TaxID=49283 RepID=UPI0035A6C815
MLRKKLIREAPLHAMLLPGIVLTFIFSYIPLYGIIIAFQNFDPTLMFHSPWVGWDNFKYVFELPGFVQSIWNTLYIAIFKIIGGIVVPVTFALLLNEIRHKKFKKSLQTLIYLPNFLSWIIVAGLLIDILSTDGIVNELLGLFGVDPIFFLGSNTWFPITMILSDIWKGFGFGTVVYLAALTSIDPSLYEAAEVDGAKRWKQTLHITLPGITPIIILMSVLSLGNVLNGGFDQIFNLYSPLVYESGDIIDTFVYRLGIEQAQYSPAAAVGLFKSAISFVLIAVAYFLADKLADYRIF